MNENQTTKGQIFEKPNANAVGAHDCARNSRGITLVALIITIIIMLILVAVTITIAIKGNLFGTAKNGAKGMSIEAYRENLEAIRVNAMMEQIKNGLTSDGFLDKVKEGIETSKVFEERQNVKRTRSSVKVTTKEGYLFKITENKVTYLGLADEQGELTINLNKDNTDFIYNPPDEWSKGPVKVSIEPRVDADELGAVLEYSIDGGEWQEYDYTKLIEIIDNGVTIKARLYSEEEDEYGDEVEEIVNKIDRLDPNPITNFSGTSTDSSITLTGSTEDAEATNINGSSGIKAYYYSIDDGETWLPQNGTLETSYTFTGLPDTTTYTTLKMKAVDYAGNEVITEAITVATKKVNKPYVGDYVNYTPDAVTTPYTLYGKYSGYSITTNKPEGTDQTITQDKLKWRILNINANGTIDLISNESTSEYVYLEGALGYNNGVYLLNDLCKTLYSNSKYNAVARSIKIEDIQDKMNLSVWDYHNYVSNYGKVQYGNATTYSNSYHYPYQWTNEKSEKNAVDGVSTNGTLGQSEQNDLTTETYITKAHTVEQTCWKQTLYNNNFKTVNTRDDQNDTSMYRNILVGQSSGAWYWVASRCSECQDGYGDFGLFTVSGEDIDFNECIRGYTSGENCYARLRPIITLPKSALDLSANYEDTGVWNLKP